MEKVELVNHVLSIPILVDVLKVKMLLKLQPMELFEETVQGMFLSVLIIFKSRVGKILLIEEHCICLKH